MQTYSHFLMTVVLGDRIKKKRMITPSRAFILGSFLPDIPLLVLTIGFVVMWWGNPETADQFLFGQMYDDYYFTNPWWIVGHNLFHAPPMILFYGLVGVGLMRTERPNWQAWGWSLLWLALGCGLHSVVDILTHVKDGPLLFFPFDWGTRFQAPISYWDPEYGGRVFGPIEHLLDLGLVVYVVRSWWQKRGLK